MASLCSPWDWGRRCFLRNLSLRIQTYCWWFRNPAETPVEVGSLSHYLQGLIHLRWLFGISAINSKKGISPIGPIILFWGWDWNHQSYSREESGFLGYGGFTDFLDQLKNIRSGWGNVWHIWHLHFLLKSVSSWCFCPWRLKRINTITTTTFLTILEPGLKVQQFKQFAVGWGDHWFGHAI